MTDSETILDTHEQYRDHYIRVTVTATPPLPHDDGEGAVEADVRVYDGHPPSSSLFSSGSLFTGSVVDSWTDDIPLYDSEDELETLIEQAKGRVDTRCGQQHGLKESATIAFERTLTEEGDGEAALEAELEGWYDG